MAWLRRAASILLIVFTLELIVNVFDPFGMQEVIKTRAAVVLQKVTSPFYGGFVSDHLTPGQKAVTVVLIDRRYFEVRRPDRPNAKPVWPLPVNTLVMGILRRIVDAKPAAVFVDIAFPDAPREIVDGGTNTRSEAVKTLTDELRLLDPGVPLLLSDVIIADRQQELLNDHCPRLFVPENDLNASSVLAPDLLRGLFGAVPATATPGNIPGNIQRVDSASIDSDGSYILAPLNTGPADSCNVSGKRGIGYIASPALALFKAYHDSCPRFASQDAKNWCLQDDIVSLARQIRPVDGSNAEPGIGPITGTGLQAYALGDQAAGVLAPRWGIRISKAMQDRFGSAPGADQCASQFYDSGWDPITAYLIQLIGPIERTFGKARQKRCAYIDTISAADLIDPRRFDPNASAKTNDVAKTFLKDRIVLLGASVPQAQDRFPSPVNGDMPGVYQHAAAVENLITSGVDFPRADISWAAWFGMLFIVVLVIAAMDGFWEFLARGFSRMASPLGELILAPLIYAATMFVCGGLIFGALALLGLPMTEIAVPLIALHVILFAGVLKKIDDRLRALLGVPRIQQAPHAEPAQATKPAQALAAPAAPSPPTPTRPSARKRGKAKPRAASAAPEGSPDREPEGG
jgi:hypothetical protein